MKEKARNIKYLLMADMTTTIQDIKNGEVKISSRATKIMASAVVVISVMMCCLCMTYGATFFDTAKDMISELYTDILGISTAVAVLCAAIALLWAFMSSSPKSTEKAIGWIKKIVICWIALNLLGLIVSYGERLTRGNSYKIS